MLKTSKPKICLVSYTGQDGNDNIGYFPLGIAMVSASLKANEYEVKLFDYDERGVGEQSLGHLCNDVEHYDVVGFSVKSGTSLKFALDGIEQIKRFYKDKTVVVGGPLVTAEPKRFLEETDADFIVVGEGEKSIVQLMEALADVTSATSDIKIEKLKNIAGIGYRHNGEIFVNPPVQIEDLDSLPMPDFESFNIDLYTSYEFAYTDLGKRKITLFTSRGCPFDCQFCTHVFGKKWRGISARRIYEIVKHLKDKYNINGIMFMDDNFMWSKERVHEFCELIKGLNIKWSCEARANSIKEDVVSEMKSSGCVAIRMGLESGSDRILKLMHKGVTLDMNKRAVACLSKLGFPVLGGFMFGVPDETKEDVKETFKFIKYIRKNAKVSKVWAYHYTPRPANPWYHLAVEKGMEPFTLKNWATLDKYQSCFFNMSHLSEKEIKRAISRVSFYTFLSNRGKMRLLLKKGSIKRVFGVIKQAMT